MIKIYMLFLFLALYLVNGKAQNIVFDNFNVASNCGILNDSVNAIFIDTSGNAWIGTTGGLNNFNVSVTSTWTPYTNALTAGGLADNYIHSVAVDLAGIIWLGTNNGGVVQYNGSSSWGEFAVANITGLSVTGNMVNCVATDMYGQVWAATAGAGIAQHTNGGTWTGYNTTSTTTSVIPDNQVNFLYTDTMGNLYAGTQSSGILITSVTTGTVPYWQVFNQSNTLLPSNTILCVSMTIDGTIWIGTDAGLVKYSGTSMYTYTTSNSQLPGNVINCLAADPIGNLWVGTDNGVARFNGSNTWSIYNTTNSNLPHNHVNSIFVHAIPGTNKTSNGDVWIGTYGGASRYIIASDVAENTSKPSVALYPNPGKGKHSLELTISGTPEVVVEILNGNGQTVYSKRVEIRSSKHTESLDLSGFAKGIYILKITGDRFYKTEKLVVE